MLECVIITEVCVSKGVIYLIKLRLALDNCTFVLRISFSRRLLEKLQKVLEECDHGKMLCHKIIFFFGSFYTEQ